MILGKARRGVVVAGLALTLSGPTALLGAAPVSACTVHCIGGGGASMPPFAGAGQVAAGSGGSAESRVYLTAPALQYRIVGGTILGAYQWTVPTLHETLRFRGVGRGLQLASAYLAWSGPQVWWPAAFPRMECNVEIVGGEPEAMTNNGPVALVSSNAVLAEFYQPLRINQAAVPPFVEPAGPAQFLGLIATGGTS